MPRRGEDFGPVPVQRHGGRPQRAADLAHGRRAQDPVVAAGVVAGDLAEFDRQALSAVCGSWAAACSLVASRARGPDSSSGGGGRAVQVPVGDDGAFVGAFGAAVGVEVLDELRPGLAERDRPGSGVAVGVAGVG